jgi:hypothetical protein
VWAGSYGGRLSRARGARPWGSDGAPRAGTVRPRQDAHGPGAQRTAPARVPPQDEGLRPGKVCKL